MKTEELFNLYKKIVQKNDFLLNHLSGLYLKLFDECNESDIVYYFIDNGNKFNKCNLDKFSKDLKLHKDQIINFKSDYFKLEINEEENIIQIIVYGKN